MTLPGIPVRFADAWALPLAAAVLAIALLAIVRERRARAGVLFPSLAILPAVRPGWRIRLRWTLLPLRVLAATLLILALARPQVGHASVEIVEQGIDIVLAVDTSSSMAATDFGPQRSRFDAAKAVIRSFVSGLSEHRVGVVIFSGEALTLSPLTLDRDAILRLMDPVSPGRILKDGTAIGTGLATSVNVLRESRAASRVIVLLTDGENNSGTITPLDAANMARLLGMRVYTIGAVPATRARTGDVEIDEQLMKRISEMNGGQYFRATDEGALLEIYREIEHLERTRVGVRRSTQYEDAYLWLLLPGLALLLIEVALSSTVFRRTP